MSLHIRYNTNDSTVMSGVVFFGDAKAALYGDDLHYQSRNNDLMVDIIGGRNFWFVPSGNRSLGEIFSFIDPYQFDHSFIKSTKPGKFNGMPGSQYDDLAYGSIFKNFQVLGSVFTGQSFVAPSYASETSCRHDTYSGSLIAKQSVFQPITYTELFYGQTIEVDVIHYSTFRKGVVNSTSPLNVTYVPYIYDATDYNFETFCRRLSGRVLHSVVTFNGGIFSRTLSNVEVTRLSDSLVVTYDMYVDSVYPYAQLYIWKGTITIPFVGAPRSRLPIVGNGYQTLYSGTHISWKYEHSVGQPWGGQMTRSMIFQGNDLETYWTALSMPILTVDAERGVCANINESYYLDHQLGKFRDSVLDNWADIVPSSVFSTVDAFKQAEGFIGPNVLQNLQKLPGIADSFPDFQEAINVLGKILRRDLSLSTLKEILDLSTSTMLKGSFEWRPYYTLVTEYIPQLVSTLHLLGDIEKNAIGRGSFQYELHDVFGRKDVTLKTRTKLVMDASPSGLLSAVLGFDALGLLPKVSNLWDLVPFSFVANWFTGIGESIRRIEYSLLLAGIPAYFVHTYSLTSPFEGFELDILEASSPDSDPAVFKLYYRDVSLHSPMPKDSKYGFGLPKDLPPMGVFGSLLYQLIFG